MRRAPLARNRWTAPQVAVLVAFAAVACASPADDPAGAPDAAPLDERVTDLLPIGPHEMVLTYTGPNASATVATGYLDLPESSDLERDCAFEVTATETFNDVELSSTTYESAKAPGSNSWHRVTATDREGYEILEGYEVGTWVDETGLAAPSALIFHPLAQSTQGNAFWCELRRTDQAARIADPETGVLEWDAAGLLEAQNAGKAAWVDALADAVGLSGGARHAFVRRWTGYVGMNAPFLIDGGQHRLVRDGDEVRWSVASLYRDGTVLEPPYLEIVFTPTERRTVDDVDAETYFERVAASEELRADLLAD